MARRLSASAIRPVIRMWDSHEPLDAYALVHMTSVAGDALVGVALADSVFFSLPLDAAKVRVALYLGLTMAPLAVAAPAMAPLLDRGGFRRAISFATAAGRSLVALLAAPRFDTLLLFPLAFGLLVLSKAHAITKNGLTMAYAPSQDGLVRANARLGRVAVVGAAVAVGPGIALLRLGGAEVVLYLATAAYGVAALLNLRLPQPDVRHVDGEVMGSGRVPSLAPAAAGTAGLRAASGFLLFLLAFALRGSDQPTFWFGVVAGAAVAGGLLGDVVAPRLPAWLREEAIVLAALLGAGVAALFAFATFELWALALFSGLAGMATEFGRLAFQSLMQRSAPHGAHGRVFVRYEIAFQLAWVGGAFIPAVAPISFRWGLILLAVFYVFVGIAYVARPFIQARA